jgi:hypothetical protein
MSPRAFALVLIPLALAPAAQVAEPPMRFTSNALNIGGEGGPVATLVEIDIERWSTDDEHRQLLIPLASNRQSDASTVLRNLKPVGVIRALDFAAEPIHYARRTILKDKRQHFFLVGSRPMRFFEPFRAPNMSAFPFTVIELDVDATGNGAGIINLAATLTGEPERAMKAVPDRFVEPVTLTKVRKRQK